MEKHYRKLLTLALSFIFAGILAIGATPAHQQEGFYLVTKVVDGDTITVEHNGTAEKVRLLGIDTPETVHPRQDVECFGKEASEYARKLLLGKEIRLEPDETQSDKDRYGRLLRYVFLKDGTHINEVMIRDGFAHEYTYRNDAYQYQEAFKQAETQARESKKGLWADDECIM